MPAPRKKATRRKRATRRKTIPAITTARQLREKMLSHAEGILDTACKLAKGELPDYKGSVHILNALVNRLLPVVQPDEDLQDFGLSDIVQAGTTMHEQALTIFNMVGQGKLSLKQAREYLESYSHLCEVREYEEIDQLLQEQHRNGTLADHHLARTMQ